MSHERQVAKEIRDEYVDTMSKVYYSYFKGYTSRLMKLQVFLHILLFTYLSSKFFSKIIILNEKNYKFSKLLEVLADEYEKRKSSLFHMKCIKKLYFVLKVNFHFSFHITVISDNLLNLKVDTM